MQTSSTLPSYGNNTTTVVYSLPSSTQEERNITGIIKEDSKTRGFRTTTFQFRHDRICVLLTSYVDIKPCVCLHVVREKDPDVTT